MKLITQGVAIATLAFITMTGTAADNDNAAQLCQKATQNQLKFAEEAKQMMSTALQYATTDEQKRDIEQKQKDMNEHINNLKTPEAQQKCLEEYKKDPKVVACFAEAKDLWATMECAPSK